MNSRLIMLAAALAAAFVPATDSAANKTGGTATVTFNTPSGLYTYCDIMHLYWSRGLSSESDDLQTNCHEDFISFGLGAYGKVKPIGNHMANGDNQSIGGYSYYVPEFEYSFPIKQGGMWNLYLWSGCCSAFLVNSATYNVVGHAGADKPVKRISLVKALVASGKIKPREFGDGLLFH
jgi:hypothetical protein